MSTTFGMKTPGDCLADFTDKVKRYRADDLNHSFAMDCAVAGWSVADWVYDDHAERLGYSKNQKKRHAETFKRHLMQQCSALGLLQDLANFRKHRKIDRYDTTLLEAREHGGGFDSSFSRDFDISRLVLITDEGEFDFEDSVVAVLDFWNRYFKANSVS